MKKAKSVLMFVLAISMCVSLAACGGGTTPTTVPTVAPTATPSLATTPEPTPEPQTGPQSGGKLTILVNNLPATYGNFKESSWQIGVTVYTFPVVESLVGMTADGPAPTKLATDWQVADDGSSLTFNLREGVKFHDGTDFNAEAVKWNIEKIRDLKKELQVIESIDCPDEYTVVLNLSEYSNTLLYHFANYNGCMISPASYEGRDEAYIATHLIGTGPFEVVSFSADTSVQFTAFADYWDEGKPYLDELEYIVTKDVNTARSALLAGQAQAWDYATPDEAVALRGQGYGVNFCPGLIRIAFSDSANESSPFFKTEVRYALEYAVDKQALVDAFGGGLYQVPVAPAAPNHTGSGAITEGRTYNPEKAMELLKEAGYPNGFKTTIYSQAATNPDLLAAIQGYLLAVGIEAEIQTVDNARMTSLRTEGWENGLLVQGLSTATSSYINALETDGPSKTKGISALVTEAYSSLLKEAAGATTPEEELRLSEELLRLTYEEAIITPFVIESRVCVFAPSIRGLDLSAMSIWFWSPGEVWIEQ